MKTCYLQIPILVLLLLVLPSLGQNDSYAKQRNKMVTDQIVARGITNKATLQAMRTVPRHLFVPESICNSAYEDYPLPIGFGQTISQPYIVAFMTEVIDPQPGMKVLEIGTGSGYQAAVLAEIVDHVYTIEIVKELAESASQRLKILGYSNVSVLCGDGYFGWEEHAPYDAIIVTAAPEKIPEPLIEQLKEGGKMIIPVGLQYMVQSLTLVKKKNGKITQQNMMPVRFVPFVQ